MKNLLVGFSLLVFTFVAAFGQIQVSIDGDYVHFSKAGTKDGTEKTFIAPLTGPTELAAVHISYPKQDRSEYVVSSNSGQYFSVDRRASRYANDKEWKKLATEWTQIKKQVTFGRIDGAVAINRMREYQFVGTDVIDTHRLVYIFKVRYLNTGKEGIEVLNRDLFKVHPEGSVPFYLGREHGKLMPVAIQDGPPVVRVAEAKE